MNKIKNIFLFFNNAGFDKLFLTAMPAFYAISASCFVFTNNLPNSILMFIGIICLQLSIKIFDDFIDLYDGKIEQRLQIEQTGMRGRYDKGIYFYKNSPRKYFYTAIILSICFLIASIYISFSQKSFLILIFVIFISILGYINYSSKTKYIIKKTGTEFIVAFLCSFGNIFLVFYSGAKCLTPQIAAASLITFFFIFNISYISSILNLKVDIMTKKTTFAAFINNSAMRIWFLIFFTLFPYILTYTSISFNIFPKTAYLTFLLIPHSIWLIYLVILYETKPQVQIKWNILMGPNKYKIIDEQNGLSWYNVRYNFARNIFCTYMIIITVLLVF